MTDTIADGKVVAISYVLTDPKGKVLDRSPDGDVLRYLHGARNIVPGLEEALTGKSVGESLTVEVPPSKGYGESRGIKAQRVLRSKFPPEANVVKGAQFVMSGEDGKPFPIWVTKVMGKQVHISPEHPLSGVTLSFDVTIESVRDATAEEVAEGRPQGPSAPEGSDEEE